MLLEDPTAALDRVKWTEKVRYVQGLRWSFTQRDYLLDIYQDEAKIVVVKKARQMEVTEFIVNAILYYAMERPNTTIIYASARGDQVGRVSRDRVATAIRSSEYIRKGVDNKDIGVEAIRFKNGSVCYFVSAWADGDAARNIPADIAFIDEVQDVTQASVEAIREGLSHSMLRRLFLVGSPKLAGSEFDRGMWRFSDQKEWEGGKWIPHPLPEQKILYSGYHISQLMAPWITPDEIEQKRNTYTKQKFENEVLGNFYTGGAVKLTIEQIMACTDNNLGWDMQSYVAPHTHYAGVDWGDRNWMIIMDRNGVVKRVIYWDDRADIQPIRDAIKKYNVRYVVADMGYGRSEVSKLQNEFGHKIWGCQYVDQQGVTFKKAYYKTPDKDEDMRKPIVNADRTDAMDIVYERIYNKKYKFPYQKGDREIAETFFQHLLAPFEEFVTAGAGGLTTKKRYARSGPDHTFHCLVYATIASMMGGGGLAFDQSGDTKSEDEIRFRKEEYYPQDREMEAWYNANSESPL